MSIPAIFGACSLTVASIFGDGAVLQRESRAPVWGTAPAGETVRVSIAGKEASAQSGDDCRWMAVLSGLPAGGPFEMRVETAAESIAVRDVMVGDVWLCSGQSNMQWTMRDVADAEREIAAASALEDVRLLLVPKAFADAPADSFEAQWTANGAEHVANFSAVAQFFAQELRRSPATKGVPIGLIDSSFGGTRVEGWIPDDVLARDFAGFALRDSMFGMKPSSLWNAMVAPVQPFGIAGVLWYQGESNANDAAEYSSLLAGMIGEWRARWQRPDLPFFVVQLPNFGERSCADYFTSLREAQARVASSVAHVGMAVTIDTCSGFDLHPKTKRAVGERLGLLTRRDVYGEDIVASGPEFDRAEAHGGEMHVFFKPSTGGLRAACGASGLSAFATASDDGVFHPAEATLDGDVVRVRSPRVAAPAWVRYAWEGNPQASLFNAAGLPAAPFRTDTFEPRRPELERQPAPWRIAGPTWSLVLSGDGQVTSLRVNGAEFLSMDDAAAPGAHFAGFWGPRRMLDIAKASDSEIVAENENTLLAIRFDEQSSEWRVKNKKGDPQRFRIALAEGVVAKATERGVDCTKGAGAVAFEGPLGIDAERMLALELGALGEATIRVVPSTVEAE